MTNIFRRSRFPKVSGSARFREPSPSGRRSSPLARVRYKPSVEWLEDRTLLTVELASVTAEPAPLLAGSDSSTNPSISASGRHVAFQSEATDLDADVTDGNGLVDVYVRDLVLDRTTLISVVPEGGRAGDGASLDPAISDDGRFVAFVSAATNLVKGTTIDSPTGAANVFVRDRDADEDGVLDESGPGEAVTTLLSIGMDGTSGDGPSGGGIFPFLSSPLFRPVISGDGRFVSFATAATDLALEDPTPADGPLVDFNGVASDVVKASVDEGTLSLVSINFMLTGAATGDLSSALNPSIDGDGSTVAFQSVSLDTLIDPEDFEPFPPFPPAQVFVGPGSSPATLVSVTPSGKDIGDDVSGEPVISRNGLHVAFTSKATNLVAGVTDVNGRDEDVFVRDLRPGGMTTLVSRSRVTPVPLTTGDDASGSLAPEAEFFSGPAISDTGRFIAFRSSATDLLDPAEGVADTNGVPDIFVFDRDSDVDGIFDEPGATKTMLVSINSAGTDSAGAGGGVCSSFAPSISGDGRLVAFNSTCADLVPGVMGTQVYVRDLVSGTTALISATISGGAGGNGSLAGLPRSVAISRSGSRVAFISDTVATDLDPAVTADPNTLIGATDVFAGTPPPDIRGVATKGDGLTSGPLSYRVVFEPAPPFEIGVYRSTDAVFDPADELLGMIPITDPDDLDVDSHSMLFSIGSGPGEIALPGTGGPAAESDADYFILFVADHLDVVAEFDGDAFAEDNTGAFSVGYHGPGGPVFIHGRESPRKRSVDEIIVATTSTTLSVTFFGSITGTLTYPLADVSGLRIRAHSGDDTVTSGPLPDLIHGGAGDDTLDGGAGDDTIDGGPGADTITGGPGDDILFDGPGDDLVDVGDGDDTVMATPGSADVFRDKGGSDTLDFSLAALPITIDLDTEAVQTIDSAGNTIRLIGQWENFVGSPFDDASTVWVKPLSVPRRLNGGLGFDRLVFDALGLPVTFDGTTFRIPGLGDVTVQGFESIETVNAAPRIIDNSDPSYSEVGPWFASDPMFPQGFNGGVRFNAAGTGNDVATWNFTNVAPGQYMVAATWTFAGDRATNTPFTIRDGGPTGPIVRNLTVNQEQNPGEFDPPEDGQNILFRNLAVVNVTGNELTVQLTDNADQFVSADAVRIEPITAARIIDDGDAGFSTGGFVPQVLAPNAVNRGAFGDVHLAQDAGDTATYNFSGLAPGPYVVSATWTANPTNATNSPFRAMSAGGSFSVQVNQQVAPDDFTEGGIPWERLGVIDVISHGDPVILDSWDNSPLGNVVADAVRLDPAPQVRGPTDVGGEIVVFTAHLTAPNEVPPLVIPVENIGIAALTLDPPMVTGAGFSVSPFGATTIPPGGSTSFAVQFPTDTPGTFAGEVSFGTNDFEANPFIFTVRVTVVDDTTPPTVTIVQPPSGASVIEGTTIVVQAEATDDIGVARVEFTAGGLAGMDDEGPFEFEFQVPTGVTQLTLGATAIDFGLNQGAAPPVVLNVVSDEPPAVSITSPVGGAEFVEGSTIVVQADAMDDVGIARVDFLVDGVLAASDMLFITGDSGQPSPFFGRVALPLGVNSATLEAVAIDTAGQSTTSGRVTLLFDRPPPAEPLPGDSNADGRFNQLDIVQVLQAGKYRTGQPATFAEGDWNRDGVFDQFDIIAALRTGRYSPGLNAEAAIAQCVDEVLGKLQ